jgi:hypothetical protein
MGSKDERDPMILPNFLIAGAAKCGTTSLYHYLKQHPDVFMSNPKEPKFLSGRSTCPGRGPGDDLVERSVSKSFGAYSALFEKAVGKAVIGEASVDTIFYPDYSIPAIQRYLGDPKIIMILRDPVARAYSAYNHLVRDGRETLSFQKALDAEEGRKQSGYRHMWLYREGGLYAAHVRAFQKNFQQVLVLLHDDLARDPLSVMRETYLFGGIDPDFIPDMKHLHNIAGVPRLALFDALFVKPKLLHKLVRTMSGAILGADRWIRLRDRVRSINLDKPKPMPLEIAVELRDYYREDVLTLQDYISRDLSAWINGKGRN